MQESGVEGCLRKGLRLEEGGAVGKLRPGMALGEFKLYLFIFLMNSSLFMSYSIYLVIPYIK
jgi:hypothetical protein